MKVYLVGGAVRDKLLGIPVKEKDWVVVGSTPEEMRTKKFKQVGKDFPVFIHPKTGEEYALARTERKSGHGYTGFEFDTNSNVTLEEDLERRDLTINAIAQDENGALIDPFNGQEDIKNRKLRHVSEAFSEDPLRVLRVARFNANFEDFVVVSETMDKIKGIVKSGELEYLTPERIWLEFYKTDYLYMFCDFLHQINVLDKLLPGCVPFAKFKPDGFREVKLKNIAHFMHENVDNIKVFCEKLKIPNEYTDLALLLDSCKEDYLSYDPSSSEECNELLFLIKKLDIRKEERLKEFLEICDVLLGHKRQSEFFERLIDKIKSYKLKKEDQKKSNIEIQSIVENAHREIAQEYIQDFLKQSN